MLDCNVLLDITYMLSLYDLTRLPTTRYCADALSFGLTVYCMHV